jgi:hypothetical protein
MFCRFEGFGSGVLFGALVVEGEEEGKNFVLGQI